MSDLEGYGKIYESTNWGEGVNNNIGWGNVYADLGAGPVNTIAPVITSDSGNVNRETPPPTLTSTTGTWTGTGVITFAYQWKRDGVSISGATSSTYSLVADDDNKYITCVITATDDEGSKSRSSNALGPVLGIPTALVNPVASGTPEVDEILTTTDGTWQGLPTIAITYQWRRDSVNISGATSNTYTLVSADLDALVDCQVTATNSIRSVSVDSNDLGPVQAAPIIPQAPSISGVPTISGTAKVGETLTATAASATGVPTPTTSWQWERSDNGTTGWASISGATSNTYTAVSADESKYLRVVQTETNTEGSDSANSAATAQVAAATDADYQAVLDRASTLGYTAPSSAQQTLQNTLVEDLKTAGVWSKLDVFYVFATDGDSDYATLNWKSPSNNQTTKVNSPTFTSNSGFTGDGISSYLDINFQPVNGSQYAQDSAHFMIYSYGDDVGSTYYGGALDTTPSVIRSLNFGGRDNNNRFGAIAINSTGADVSSTNSVMTDVGFNLITRTSSTSVKAYKDNSLIGTFTRTSDTSSYQLARNIMLLARNLNGSANSYGTRKLAIVAIGSDVDSLASDYYTAINDYFTAL